MGWKKWSYSVKGACLSSGLFFAMLILSIFSLNTVGSDSLSEKIVAIPVAWAITFPGKLVLHVLSFVYQPFEPTQCSLDFFVQPSYCANAPYAIGFFQYMGLTLLISFIFYILLGVLIGLVYEKTRPMKIKNIQKNRVNRKT